MEVERSAYLRTLLARINSVDRDNASDLAVLLDAVEPVLELLLEEAEHGN